ncbi:hypothetical protein HL658_21840 [Azospirillum sp. RWY-5-1]|uniref:Uncharacterized protein n=1 Tax=Azospirillum oleiclasticum TaxID=2735135 RepID=A0ABX2TAM3_9PROT|nr:hypothetical protein [Azospirillum oleiclasticum]NYZ15190.1 hypothetical protein [Azospirillum oleiclasticum]NYZ21389.1 hypothetical protein [Azospirillum oleiclasticum]
MTAHPTGGVGPGCVGRLDAAAKAAQAAEIAFRQSVADGIARHERQRQFAFRRLGLVKAVAAAVAGAETAEAATAVGAAALQRELDWHAETEARTRILDAFQAVTLAVWAESRPADDAADDAAVEPVRVEDAIAAFEAWYETAIGQPFLALLDVEYPELPVVEF